MTEPTTGPAGGGGQEGAEAPPAERLDRVEAGLERLTTLVERIVPGTHAQAEQHTEDRLDRPTSVEEQVKAELAKARKADADKAKADKDAADAAAEKETMAARLKALEEKPPAERVRRSTRVMGWDR